MAHPMLNAQFLRQLNADAQRETAQARLARQARVAQATQDQPTPGRLVARVRAGGSSLLARTRLAGRLA